MNTTALLIAAALALAACEAPSAGDPEVEQGNAGEDAVAPDAEADAQPSSRPDGAVDPIRVPEGT
jgi:hypothetical protein